MENQTNTAQAQTQYVVVKKKSKAKWIIIALIVVIIIAAVGSTGGNGDNEPTIGSIDDISNVEASNNENKPSTKDIKSGSTVSDGDIKVSYISCNTNFTNYNKYLEPEKGNKVIEVVFDFENTSKQDQSVGYFECYADGAKCESYYGVDGASFPSYESISAGRKLGASKFYYEVPESAEIIELEYECDMFSNEKYIFIVE